jgi:hypothetical protein
MSQKDTNTLNNGQPGMVIISHCGKKREKPAILSNQPLFKCAHAHMCMYGKAACM